MLNATSSRTPLNTLHTRAVSDTVAIFVTYNTSGVNICGTEIVQPILISGYIWD